MKKRALVSRMCELLGVSTSGFYEWVARTPSNRTLGDAWLIEKIKAIHETNRGVYGAPRVHEPRPYSVVPWAEF